MPVTRPSQLLTLQSFGDISRFLREGVADEDSRQLRDSLGVTVFIVTHDLDTLYTVCDRVAVLAQRRVLVVDTVEQVERHDDPWVREYFQGPRGRAAARAATPAFVTAGTI